VDIFFDTTVLVAASEHSHPHYAQARPALLRVAVGQDKGFMALHSIAEVYAVLTRLPVRPRIHPVEAARIVTENILPHFEVVTLGPEDYLEALTTMASGGWSGAKIYDAMCGRTDLHIQSQGLQAVGAGQPARDHLRAISDNRLVGVALRGALHGYMPLFHLG